MCGLYYVKDFVVNVGDMIRNRFYVNFIVYEKLYNLVIGGCLVFFEEGSLFLLSEWESVSGDLDLDDDDSFILSMVFNFFMGNVVLIM